MESSSHKIQYISLMGKAMIAVLTIVVHSSVGKRERIEKHSASKIERSKGRCGSERESEGGDVLGRCSNRRGDGGEDDCHNVMHGM
jgi:hypothetical protein